MVVISDTGLLTENTAQTVSLYSSRVAVAVRSTNPTIALSQWLLMAMDAG